MQHDIFAGTPEAEIAVDAGLAKRILVSQHPDLAELSISFAASGWDNEIYRLGDDVALRLPRRQAAEAPLLNEQRWLPFLQTKVTLRVPAPVRIGVPENFYPWHWSVTDWFEGETADAASPDESQGDVLAAFFESLHQPAPADAPRSLYRGAPLTTRKDVFEQRVTHLARAGVIIDANLLHIWDEALRAPIDTEASWIHGDPHPRNVLVRNGRIAAIIDWGDLAQGDRACDLAGIWMVLPALETRRRAMTACLSVSAATWRRAKGWAALFGVTLLSAGCVDDPGMATNGIRIFERLIEGP